MNKTNNNGVALVAVLAILTVLAIIATAFITTMSNERQMSIVSIAKLQSDILIKSAIEHAFSLLEEDSKRSSGWDSHDEKWNTALLPKANEEAVDIDGLKSYIKAHGNSDARWFYIKDNSDKYIGRYAIKIEDENGKINVNTAIATSPEMQNQGVEPFEIMLADGKGRGLPITKKMAKRIIAYRYGRDKKPGQANVDDNMTEATFAGDQIDNDADQIYDEENEGIDEPHEYTPLAPKWDDRAFVFLDEVFDVTKVKNKRKAQRAFKRYATIYTSNKDLYFDEVDAQLKAQLNLNVADKNQLRKVLKRANAQARFEKDSKSMHNLIANLMDYRDENHSLSTVESAYGVEGVCFNEIIAHDASFIRETDWSGWWPYLPNKRDRILTFNRFYGLAYGLSSDKGNRWNFKSMKKAGRDGANQLVKIKLSLPSSINGGGNEHKYFSDFLACDKTWAKDFWKNATATIYNGESTKTFTVVTNPQTSAREFTLSCSLVDYDFVAQAFSNSNGRVSIANNWDHGGYMHCGVPQCTETFLVPTPDVAQEKFYYKIFSLMHTSSSGKSRNRFLDMDGDPAKYTEQEELKDAKGFYKLQFPYQEGKAIKANKVGYLPVTITSSKRTKASSLYQSVTDKIVFLRPDIIELINISDQTISLKNWKVVVNTGSEANTLAIVNNSVHYSPRSSGRYTNPNPSIAPNEYFYLTNNREIFDLEYCNKSRTYGDSKDESNQIFEIPDARWGIEYEVSYTDHDNIEVIGSDWEDDQMEGEMVEYIVERRDARRDLPNGHYAYVYGNTANKLYVMGQDPRGTGLAEGDRIRIRGLPRQGGFVSFTLKNEYNQVVARTTEYGSVDEKDYGWSTEKYDPTHYNWLKIASPTIGGNIQKSESHVMRGSSYIPAHVKNQRFSTIAEIQKVRKSSDWENIGQNKSGDDQVNILKALSKYFCMSGIRLEAEEKDAHVEGWKPAFGIAKAGRDSTLVTENANWANNIWSNQTLRILSGPLKNERFTIISSNPNSVKIDGYSIPSYKQLNVKPGTKFNVGPGYSTSMYYARKDNEAGIWEWKGKGITPGDFGLYIYGLCDSINTTEFLEENNNAALDVAVWNYVTRTFDSLPLKENKKNIGNKDAYSNTKAPSRHRIDKSDGVYCGKITPHHFSSNGGIKIKIIPHNLQSTDCSGFAWFDYAFLAPTGAEGRLNINTAPPQVLSALRGITPELAKNIWLGTDQYGKSTLKPYQNISDLLDVKNFKATNFSQICNLITTRSDQFRIQVIAQSLVPTDSKKKIKIKATSNADLVIDRSTLINPNINERCFKILYQQ